MTDQLRVSVPKGPDEADAIAKEKALADLQAREKLLTKNIADLEKRNALKKKKEATVASGATPPQNPAFVGNKTFGRIKSMQCLRADVAPPLPPAQHELRPWDGVVRGSPAEEYVKEARGGLDPVHGDSWHHQQSVNAQDAIIGEGFGVILGKLLAIGSKMIGTVRGPVKAIPKPIPEPLPKALPERLPTEPKPKVGPGDGLYVEKPNKDPRYQRGKFRKGVRDQVWEDAKDADGIVRDPVSGKEMKFDEPWDMGHEPGYEHWKHQESASARDISREQFLNEYNTASKYRPELPSSNRSHAGEIKTSDYFGD